MVLASAALHGPGVSILRRALTLGFLGWRCLLEALFLVVSIVIVAASKVGEGSVFRKKRLSDTMQGHRCWS